jgi:DNA polymerase
VDLFARGGKIYEETAAQIFGVAVEDVTKDQRFLGKEAVLGCNYGMGPARFIKACKRRGQTVPADLAEKVVHGWREINFKTRSLWGELGGAARNAVEAPGTTYKAGPFAYRVEDEWLQCRLPSGRLLWYYRPEIRWTESANGMGAHKLHHWGVNGVTKQWEDEPTWGGKLLENVIQGTCRDFLAGALLRLEAAGYNPVLSVHDEAIAETAEDFGSVEEFLRLITELPKWADGFPLKAEGGSGVRYAKA